MQNSRVSTQPPSGGDRPSGPAGTIARIKLENFMCHENLQIEFDDHVNFITGQNGSGKSAILTALCVAFGCRAKSTQRAATLKDFIKTGCHHTLVLVELKNTGVDAFKHQVYGDSIIIERRISESTASITMKDCQGRKVAGGREEFRELVEHFNIDVENPCVVMSQDKSREFLHSGSGKDKFKATLLQQVDELLLNIKKLLDHANALVNDLEKSIQPILKELHELQGKIKSMEHLEEISEKAKELKKKLAWSWVYDVNKQVDQQSSNIEKLKEKVPVYEARIKKCHKIVEDLKDCFIKKKTDSDSLVEGSMEMNRKKNELQQSLSKATQEKLQLGEEYQRLVRKVDKLDKQLKALQAQVRNIQDQRLKDTQAEEYQMEEKLLGLEDQLKATRSLLEGLKDEEESLSMNIDGSEQKLRHINHSIRQIQQHQTNKVTAFGGDRVTQLLRVIENHSNKFRRPPIGPIGVHVQLVNGDAWSIAVENAIGRLLDSFIVTDYQDSRLLRQCGKEINYHQLQIIIYDFSIPRLVIPDNRVPSTGHPTILSILHADNPTVMNVLVDKGHIERQVLVQDYEMGKEVTFIQRVPNLKEVYTKEGFNMFFRGSVQTILPPNRRCRAGRLCSTYSDQIQDLKREVYDIEGHIQQTRRRKRDMELDVQNVEREFADVKRRRLNVEKDLASKKLVIQDLKNSRDIEATFASQATVDELTEEISEVENQLREKEILLVTFKEKMNAAEEEVQNLKASFEELCELAKVVSNDMGEATNDLSGLEKQLHTTNMEKAQLEKVLSEKLIPAIKEAEQELCRLQNQREEYYEKASLICPESEVEALGGCNGSTPEQLSAQLNRFKERLLRETRSNPDSIDDLRLMYEKKQKKILRKQQTYEDFRQKLNACMEAVDIREKKFQRNASLLRRQFNGHLRKKGISGNIKVSYEEKTLAIEVKMPQDASSIAVRDTRGLSGGERSFLTLCFAMALHEMIEAPFRAMDEFDVFMDAVSRKISLDTLVDFAYGKANGKSQKAADGSSSIMTVRCCCDSGIKAW
ncbi:Structural maintenance of chromosomes protein 6B-like protein [Drosera capensis]